jgi:hypothetical protein
MNRFIRTTLLSAVATASLAGFAHAQSTPSDPLGINASDDTSITRQRGSLQGGFNSGLGELPSSFRNRDTVSSWSFENGDIILHHKDTAK